MILEIIYTKRFKKSFLKLPAKIRAKFKDRIVMFMKNPDHLLIKAHPLKGSLIGFRSFAITGDYRTIYIEISHNSVKLIDIGTHNQIY